MLHVSSNVNKLWLPATCVSFFILRHPRDYTSPTSEGEPYTYIYINIFTYITICIYVGHVSAIQKSDLDQVWAVNALDRDEVHFSVRWLLDVPHLARPSRPWKYRPRPCLRRLPAAGAFFVFGFFRSLFVRILPLSHKSGNLCWERPLTVSKVFGDNFFEVLSVFWVGTFFFFLRPLRTAWASG